MKFTDISKQITEVSQHYHYRGTPGFIISLQKLITYILRAITDFLSSLHIPIPASIDSAPASDVIRSIVITVGIVCVAILVYFAWIRAWQIKRKQLIGKLVNEPLEHELDAKGWETRAHDLAKNQDWSSACRALYFAVLRKLDECGILEFAPTKTNYEYWYSLSKYKTLQKQFRQLFDRVENIWFGQQTASQAEFDQTANNLREIYTEIENISLKNAAVSGASSTT